MTLFRFAFLAALFALGLPLPAASSARIHRVAEMTAVDIRALDAAKTVVLLPGGILEQHGPHLPSFTDGYSNEWLMLRIAEKLVANGHDVLVFPMIPLGHEGANEIGARHVSPGTYSVRRTTLRAIFMDLATELGEQGFRKILVVHGHGAPVHNLMLDQAGEYFRDSYRGTMVHLRGLMPTEAQRKLLGLSAPALDLSDEHRAEIGIMDEHAGFDETSRLLFLRPDLVAAIVSELPPLTVSALPEFFSVAREEGWAGYLSSPRLARAQHGAKLQQHRAEHDAAIALAIVEGRIDERDIPRYSAMMTGNPGIMQALSASDRNEAARAKRQADWLERYDERH